MVRQKFQDQGKSKGLSNSLDLEILAVGKRIGLSFFEINMLTCQDLLDFACCFYGDKDEGGDQKISTPAEVEAFFRGGG